MLKKLICIIGIIAMIFAERPWLTCCQNPLSLPRLVWRIYRSG